VNATRDISEYLFWWGVALVALVTIYWAAVWWWLPKISRGRRPPEKPKRHAPKR